MELFAFVTLLNCLFIAWLCFQNSHLQAQLKTAKHRIDVLVQVKQAEYSPYKQLLELPPTQDKPPTKPKK